MLNKTIFLQIILYFYFCTNYIHSQEYNWPRNNYIYKTAISECDGVLFKIELMDSIYKIHDTVIIKYEVYNKREDTIIIIDPYYIYWRPVSYTKWDKNNCQYIYDLFGTWFYNPGYDQSFLLAKLPKGQKFSFIFKLLIEKEENDSFCTNGLDYGYKDLENIKSRMVTFYTSYIPLTKDLVIFRNSYGYWDFPSYDSGIYFDVNLRRFNIGPLWFRVKK
jgi:hypothetical protein